MKSNNDWKADDTPIERELRRNVANLRQELRYAKESLGKIQQALDQGQLPGSAITNRSLVNTVDMDAAAAVIRSLCQIPTDSEDNPPAVPNFRADRADEIVRTAGIWMEVP